MEKAQLENVLLKQIEFLIDKAERAQVAWAESRELLDSYIFVYESEAKHPLPDELSSRVALLWKPRRKYRGSKETI